MLLLPVGAMCVRMGDVTDGPQLILSSVLQLVAGDAQRPQGNSWEGARRPWHISPTLRRLESIDHG